MEEVLTVPDLYSGVDELAAQLNELGEAASAVLGYALYDGAAVIADAYIGAIRGLPVGTPKNNSPTGHPFEGLTPELVEELAAGVGIAHFDDTGDGRSTSVSIEGYFSAGQPLPMIARSLESGSSVRQKHPFVRHAVNAAKAACEQAIAAAAERKISEIVGEE